jgi:ribosomal protein S18 acetylase RimI-like enzyme
VQDQNFTLIRTLEELSLNAWPCLQQILDDGWVLRFAEGYTKRANSVTPLYLDLGTENLTGNLTRNLTEKIKRCETVYSSWNLPSIFRLTDTAQWSILDQSLSEMGYTKQDTISVQVKSITNHNVFSGALDFALEHQLSTEWLDHFVHTDNLPLQHWNTLSTMLEIIPNTTCYGYLKDRHRLCSIGLGVLEKNYLGIFCLTTAQKQRRQGYATQLIAALTDWGRSQGATTVYLQVETSNQAGINLYNKLGFTEAYQYFYRIKS